MFERNTNQRESICNSKRRKENYLNVCVNDERERERERENGEPKKEKKIKFGGSCSPHIFLFPPFLLPNVENIFRSMDVVNVCAHLDLQIHFAKCRFTKSMDRWKDAPQNK